MVLMTNGNNDNNIQLHNNQLQRRT